MSIQRYRVDCSYRGTNYAGWQAQPHASTVQGTIENAFSTLIQMPTAIVGCGRTDAGVHAQAFTFHVDLMRVPDRLLDRLNRMLPPDIVLHRMEAVSADFHARFDARSRSYIYRITGAKSPFDIGLKTYWPTWSQLDLDKLHAVAELVQSYDSFYPFCKTRSDVQHMTCHITESVWSVDENNLQADYTISANRFLRGMVRLIVGISVRVAEGKVALDEIRYALDTQTRLSKSYSVPPEGLTLTNVMY